MNKYAPLELRCHMVNRREFRYSARSLCTDFVSSIDMIWLEHQLVLQVGFVNGYMLTPQESLRFGPRAATSEEAGKWIIPDFLLNDSQSFACRFPIEVETCHTRHWGTKRSRINSR